MKSGGAFILCFLLCARLVDGAEKVSSEKPLFRDFMGINGHTVLFKPELYRPVAGLVRDYHPAEWDLGKNTDSVPPFPFARNGVNWNEVYGGWKKAGWRTDVSLMFETIARNQWKDLGKDSRNYAQRFARAFGLSGTNALVESVEIGNEPGKFNDADYRRVFESMARGLKNGDARLRIVTGALTTGRSHEYAKSVACVAGLEEVYDVLNVHSYAQMEGWPTWKRSFPEDPALKDFLPEIKKMCEWRDAHAGGKAVWITEFGYDASTRKPDEKTEFKKWQGVTEVQQAQWTVRSWLVFASLPVQRVYLYFFNDDDEPHVHGSSGLTRKFQPKPAFYAVAHLYQTLGEYRFGRAVTERPGEEMVYEFVHGRDPKRRVWVAWSPTGRGRKTTIRLAGIKGEIVEVEQMPLDEKKIVLSEPGSGELEIGESPRYLFLQLK